MKWNLLFALLCPFAQHAQSCDSLLSEAPYVERYVELSYRNCHHVDSDTMYQIVRWHNIDPAYQTTLASDKTCYSLYHSQTGVLLIKNWQEGDTSYSQKYYETGELKSSGVSVFTIDPYYFIQHRTDYYKNGQIKFKSTNELQRCHKYHAYYPNGSLEYKGNLYGYNPEPCGEFIEYYPNGTISSVKTFSMPDESDDMAAKHQSFELLKAVYYDPEGKEIDHDANEYHRLYIPVYPPAKGDFEYLGDNLYPASRFSEQTAYANEMTDLKQKIRQQLKLPNDCTCRKGVAWISLTVQKNGTIELHEVQCPDPGLQQPLEQAIHSVRKWPAARLDGKRVDTYVYTFLALDE